jgi:phage terminase large subunit-like protein
MVLDAWQDWLLRAILETFPPEHERAGQLRFRRVLVSMGRQNGKSTIAAALAIWGLLRKRGGLTIGIASNVEQSNIVFDRTRKIVTANPELADLFKRITTTRGLEMHSGATYSVKPAKEDSLQGLAVHTGIVDEVHIVKPQLWDALVAGTGARSGTMVIGITTAGADDSELLKSLYSHAEKGIAGDSSYARFGAFIWEASESRVPDDDAELVELLKPANPRLASGLIDAEEFVSDVRGNTEGGTAGIIRYRLNRFVSSTGSFMDLAKWAKCQSPIGTEWPTGQPVFAIDWTAKQGYATIAAAVRDEDGIIHTKLVRWVTHPTIESLVRDCEHLAQHWPSAFVMGATLRELGNELKRRGYPVSQYGVGDMVRASNSFLARTARATIQHAGDPLLTLQLPRTVLKTSGDEYRISREESSTEIDAVIATVMAVHQAEVTPGSVIQVF